MEKHTNNKHRIKRRGMLKYLGSIGLLAGIGGATALSAQKENELAESRDIRILVDFADSDHREMVMNYSDSFRGMDAELLMRSYHYIDTKNKIPSNFTVIHEQQKRNHVLARCQLLITPCLMTALEAKVKGSRVIYIHDKLTSHLNKNKAAEMGLTLVDVSQQLELNTATTKLLA